MLAFSLVLNRLTSVETRDTAFGFKFAAPTPPDTILYRIEREFQETFGSQFGSFSQKLIQAPDKRPVVDPSAIQALQVRVAPLLDTYERIRKADAAVSVGQRAESNFVFWGRLVATLLVSVGVVALVLFAFQVCITFARYYARLAELYETQADAFDSSEGNLEVALALIEALSPTAIAFGAFPSPLHDRVVDAAAGVPKTPLGPAQSLEK